ncbi:MAG: TspO/MBR family protein, partial [Clostridia bacterium]|nr:TspO/MBR family protein [Clostridia bacterium]
YYHVWGDLIMKIKNRIFSCFKRAKTDGRAVIIGIIIVFFAGVLSRLLSGSPIYMLRFCGLWNKVPKAWVFTLIWSFWYIFLGFCFGFVLGSKPIGREVSKYKGSLWFVIMLVFNVIWYPLFFKAGAIFIALIDVIVIMLFCFLCAVEYFKVYRAIGVCIFLHFAWLIWCFFMNAAAFFRI